MSDQHFALSQLELAVRHGQSPDDPKVLEAYLLKSASIIDKESDRHVKRRLCYRVANTLLDTICDTYVAKHWRNQCMNAIYKPIHAIERFAVSEPEKHQIRHFRYQLRTLGNYFL